MSEGGRKVVSRRRNQHPTATAMPTATRRQAQTRSGNQQQDGSLVDVTNDEPVSADGDEDIPVGVEMEEAEEDQVAEADEEEELMDHEPELFPPPGLKEISSLASWTVSTAKPGNGVAALRSPDTAHFWQSDGPQPHLLSIHFFKLVAIVHMRIYLDFENDESYTPTKIQFLAGMGVHDVQEFAEMSFEQPTGWIDVDFSNVGPVEPDDEDDEGEAEGPKAVDWSKRPVLRAFLVQVRILENHQNGKDTHLRAVQLFARDEAQSTWQRTTSPAKSHGHSGVQARPFKSPPKEQANIKLAPWMLEPDLR